MGLANLRGKLVRVLLAIGLGAVCASASAAGNWENGYNQYGAICTNCHNTDPNSGMTDPNHPTYYYPSPIPDGKDLPTLTNDINSGLMAQGNTNGENALTALRANTSETTILTDISAYLNHTSVPIATVGGVTLAFGNVPVDGTTTASTSFRIYNTGNAALQLSSIAISDTANFGVSSSGCSSITSVGPNNFCTISVTFKPQSVSPFSGVNVTMNANNYAGSLSVGSFSGTGVTPPTLSISPPTNAGVPQPFSAHIGSSSAPFTFTLKNTGDASTSIGLTSITLPSGYSNSGTCRNPVVTLNGNSANSCTIVLTYTPAAPAGTTPAQLSISTSNVGAGTIYLSGTSIGDSSLSLGAVTPTFPVTLIGHPVSGTVAITNGGTANATVGTTSITPSGTFTNTTTCDGTTIAFGGGSCSLSVTFMPTVVADNQTATLSVPYTTATASEVLTASAKQLTASPAIPSTLNAPIGGSSPVTIQISNPSGIGTFLAPIVLGGSADFHITSNGCGATLAAASSCSIVVTFTPSTTSAVSSTLNVHYGPSAGQNTTQSVATVTINGSTQLVPGILVTPTTLAFPPTLPNTTTTLPLTVQNTGNATLNLTNFALTNNAPADFAITANTCGASIAANGPSCQVTVSFTPSTQSPRSSNLVISTNATPSTTTVPLTGTTLLRPLISLSATALSFGSTIINTDSSLMSVVVTNTGNIDLHLSSVSVTGTNPGDFIQVGSTCASGGVVTATTSCNVTLKFNTPQLGAQSASLQIVHDAAGSPSSVSLTGTGIPVPAPDIQLNQTSLTFAPLIIGTVSPTQTVTLRNSGTANLVFSSITPTGAAAADYTATGGCAIATPVVPGATCDVTVGVTPSIVGPREASLAIVSNAASGTLTLPLHAIGLAVPVPVIMLTPSTLAFGSRTVNGLYPPSTVQLQNSGTAVLQIGAIAVTGAGFADTTSCGATLAVGATCSISIVFTPTAVGTNYTGQLSVTGNANAAQSVPLTGAGVAQTVPMLTWQPVVSTLAFGNVVPGSSSAIQSVMLLNAGPGGVDLQLINVVGTNATNFSATGTCIAGTTLYEGQTCRIDITFAPGSSGAKQATIQVASTGTSPTDVTLTGNGLGGASAAAAVSTVALGFDATAVGARSVPLSVTLSSSGVAAVSVSAMTVSGPFTIQSSTCPTPPFTLASGIECTVTISFSPTVTGTATGKLAVVTDADPAELDVALSGNASAAPETGSGGCTIGAPGSPADPMLWLMVLLAAACIVARRRENDKKTAQASGRDAGRRRA